MLSVLVYVLIVAVAIGFLWWLMDYLPVPEPMNKMVKVVSMVIGFIVIIYALLSLAGVGGLPALR